MKKKDFAAIRQVLRPVRLVVSDVDGTLAKHLCIDSRGQYIKFFSLKDGSRIAASLRAGIPFVMLSGIDSPAVRKRARALGVDFFLRDRLRGSRWKDPLEFFERRYGVRRREILYIGDEWVDLWWMRNVGVSAAPADAEEECRRIADIVTTAAGGEGAVSEVLTLVLRAKGVYNSTLAGYLETPQ